MSDGMASRKLTAWPSRRIASSKTADWPAYEGGAHQARRIRAPPICNSGMQASHTESGGDNHAVCFCYAWLVICFRVRRISGCLHNFRPNVFYGTGSYPQAYNNSLYSSLMHRVTVFTWSVSCPQWRPRPQQPAIVS